MGNGRIIEKPQYEWNDHEGNRIKGEAVMAAEPKRRYAVVRDADGYLWKRGNTRWTCQSPVNGTSGRLGWSALVSEYGPLTVVVEDPRKSAEPEDDSHEPDWLDDGVRSRLDGRVCRVCGKRENWHDQ